MGVKISLPKLDARPGSFNCFDQMIIDAIMTHQILLLFSFTWESQCRLCYQRDCTSLRLQILLNLGQFVDALKTVIGAEIGSW